MSSVYDFVTQHLYSDAKDFDTPFVFGVHLDAYGKPVLGTGADDDHFHLGITCRSMLERLISTKEDPTLLLHNDATYKINSLGFPVISLGRSDVRHKFACIWLAVA